MSTSRIIITGRKKPVTITANTGDNLQLEAIYDISNSVRGDEPIHTIDLSGDRVAEFEFNDGTIWMADRTTLHELFPQVNAENRSGDGFVIPSSLKSTQEDRGFFGDIALNVIKIFTKKRVSGAIVGLAQKLETSQLKGQEGLRRLDHDFSLQEFDFKSSAKPFLLFIHGTNSSTAGAYGELLGTDVWSYMKSNYGQNILAFQHRTLTQSPLKNAADLAESLPKGAELHIISHSRGGLIGDILCRFCKTDNGVGNTGFSRMNIELLKKETGREEDIANIQRLNNAFLKKDIKVKKFVRVACPAAGTKLASQRLANIFNVFLNLFGGKLNPVADIMKGIIAEAIKTKDDVNALPGIEAMNPESPFLKILNDRTPGAGIADTSLAVISGNSQISLKFKALKIIALRLFFQQRNDLVVNTDSMYLGSSRNNKIQYFFDEGSEVDHVTYFSNSKTREALLLALKTNDGEPIPGFTIINQLEVPGSDRDIARGLEHGELFSDSPTGKRPIVVLLPGIMGSNLKRKNKRIWINYWQFLTGGLLDLEDVTDNGISAVSLIKTSYGKLADHLKATYDVVVFPFDWRKQLNECAADFKNEIEGLLQLNQPIKIIGHSMGGVLVRDFIVKHPDTWDKLNNSKDFRLLFLGSPLGGSMRIPAVLFGYDAIIRSLSILDQRHTKRELLGMFSAFPGILSLLPLTTGPLNDFANEKTWQNMRDSFGDSTWPIPSKKVLDEFKKYRDDILKARETEGIEVPGRKNYYDNMVYIAGKDKATPCDYYNDVIPPRTELVFLYTGEGDQSVTWESGIPGKLIERKAVYYVNVTHGALANERDIFNGIDDILEKGFTSRLSRTQPQVRGEEKKFRINEVYDFDLSERGLENTILGLKEESKPRPNRIPIEVSVSNGDLSYASYPVLAGHFKNDGIMYAEGAIDKNMGMCLSARQSIDIYPGPIGTSEVFLNNAGSDFTGTIIVGLGEPGTLSPFQLAKTVEQGAANYLLGIQKNGSLPNGSGISSLIIGCGYGGLSIEDSIKSIIEGVNNANQKVVDMSKASVRTIQHIEFIELYQDRALQCMYALSKIENNENKVYNIKIVNKKIKPLFGSRKRLLTDSSEEWWNRISVKVKEVMPVAGVDKNDKDHAQPKGIRSLIFGSSTGDSREEERELFSSTPLIDLFIDEISIRNNWTEGSAKAIFELMIPNEFKERLKRKGSISWILDKGAANYPWELLQDSSINAKPLCINAGMIRQLLTPDFRIGIKRSTNEKALIVGDPDLSNFVSQLPGARREAETVDKLFSEQGYLKTTLINASASDIIRNLFCDDYKIIHLAGHGVFKPASPRESGMVIGKNLFLSTFDIEQMSSVPELVFVNCCHLGNVDGSEEKYFRDRYKLAANIGTQLIEMGVKAVIAAGWAVADESANEFARKFYEEMFRGSTFGKAVKEARGHIYKNDHLSNNTWGAYQCYGDPFYKLVNRWNGGDKKYPPFINFQEAEIELENLYSNLDNRGANPVEEMKELLRISKQIDEAGIRTPAMTELEALIYAELCDYTSAIKKFEELLQTEESLFQVSSLEKYHGVLLRKYAVSYFSKDPVKVKIPETKVNEIISNLHQMLKISPTAERYTLLASAYKRKAVFSSTAEKRKKALASAAYYYYKASHKHGHQSIYCITNWIELEIILRLNAKKEWSKKEVVQIASTLFIDKDDSKEKIYELFSKDDTIKKIEDLSQKCSTGQTNDFWQLTDIANIHLCRLFLENKDPLITLRDLKEHYEHVWRKAGSPDKRKGMVENIRLLYESLAYDGKLKNNLKELKETLEKLVDER